MEGIDRKGQSSQSRDAHDCCASWEKGLAFALCEKRVGPVGAITAFLLDVLEAHKSAKTGRSAKKQGRTNKTRNDMMIKMEKGVQNVTRLELHRHVKCELCDDNTIEEQCSRKMRRFHKMFLGNQKQKRHVEVVYVRACIGPRFRFQ